MTVEQVMSRLESLGTEQTRKVWMRHGARQPFFGVKVGDLKGIVAALKKEVKAGTSALPSMHDYSLALYATGNSDAMYLAGLIADPKRMDREILLRWADAAYWYMLSDFTVAWVTAESGHGWELANEWIHSGREMTASAGWATLGGVMAITPDDQLDIPAIRELIGFIRKNIHGSANRVRHSMNHFLIAAGGYVPELTPLCVETASAVGKVYVDMGGTSCKVPDAREYIGKMQKAGKLGVKRKVLVC